MKGHWTQWILAVVLIAALGATGLAYRGTREAQGEIDGLRAEVAALDESLRLQREDLRAAVDTIIEASGAGNQLPLPVSAETDSGAISQVVEEQAAAIASLRDEIAALRTEIARRDVATAMNPVNLDGALPMVTVSLPAPPTEEEIVSWEEILLSRRSTFPEKLDSLRRLRMANARSEAIADHMAALYFDTEHAALRADIFRQLDGITTPQLREALLSAVAHDEAPDVREEAAETLEHFLPDADVQEWLEFLATEDADANVRRQALESLEAVPRVVSVDN